jgi:hypothetical protein
MRKFGLMNRCAVGAMAISAGLVAAPAMATVTYDNLAISASATATATNRTATGDGGGTVANYATYSDQPITATAARTIAILPLPAQEAYAGSQSDVSATLGNPASGEIALDLTGYEAPGFSPQPEVANAAGYDSVEYYFSTDTDIQIDFASTLASHTFAQNEFIGQLVVFEIENGVKQRVYVGTTQLPYQIGAASADYQTNVLDPGQYEIFDIFSAANTNGGTFSNDLYSVQSDLKFDIQSIGDAPPPPPPPPSSVPEPASWMMMICGFGMAGAVLRRTRRAGGSAGSALPQLS